MNIHDIQRCFTLVCAAGGIVCIAAILLYAARLQLRQLFDRWLALGRLGQCVSLLMLTVFVLYGGTKPSTNDVSVTGGAVTNDVPSSHTGTTGVPPVGCGTFTGTTGVSPVGCGAFTGTTGVPPVAAGQLTGASPDSQIPFANCHQLTNWTARGAWNDWRRIDFPDGFAFPYGTNLLTGVTLLSYGEIRENLLCSPSTFTMSLPLPVSLEPGVSTCAYGLTASNSFVFAWHDACVEREATNRVDAAIELFASGDVQVRFGDSETNIVARPPEGFVGSDQDDAWALAAFPADYAAITNKGYEAWLMEDKVGINEQNGLYKVSITVSTLPPDDMPCYLVCGPYKVVVTSPGTYSFPLEVLEEYTARTYPIALPLRIEYDDGYRADGESSAFGFSAPPRNAPQLLGLSAPYIYPIFMSPSIYGSPLSVQLQEAKGALISLWANISGAARWAYRSLSGLTELRFTCPTEAEIEEAMVEDLVEIFMEIDGQEYGCILSIEDDHSGCLCGCAFDDECTCGSDCPWCHHDEDNNSIIP